jgi:uncharacterized RDD family membrane protein YckC
MRRRKDSGPTILGRYAGFFSRLVAFVLDRLIAFGIAFVIVFVIQHFANLLRIEQMIESLDEQTLVRVLVGFLFGMLGIYILVSTVYDILFWMLAGQTPGKRVLGLRVLRTNGERLRFRNALGRQLGYWISAVFFLGFVWILFDNKRQGFHDKLGGTVVVYSWPVGRLRGTFVIEQVQRFTGGSSKA